MTIYGNEPGSRLITPTSSEIRLMARAGRNGGRPATAKARKARKTGTKWFHACGGAERPGKIAECEVCG